MDEKNNQSKGANLSSGADDWERPITTQSRMVANSQVAPPSAPTQAAKVIELARPGFLLPSQLYSNPHFEESSNPAYPNGVFAGYPIIGGYSGVNGGVYLANDLSEAIVLEESISVYDQLYADLTMRLAVANQEGRHLEDVALGEVQEIVIRALRYTPTPLYKAAQLEDLAGIPLVSFNFYLQVRSGSARHLTILAAYLLEKLIQREVVGGRFYVDNALNHLSPEQESLTYTNSLGMNQRFAAAQQGLKPKIPDFNPFND